MLSSNISLGGMGECHTEYGEEQWRTQIHIFIVADRQV